MGQKFVTIGDSIVDSMIANGVSILRAGDNTVTDLAVAGNTNGQQLAAWEASAVKGDLTYSVAFIQCGVNDVRTAVPVATSLANMASLINSIRTNNPNMLIVLGLMLPARGDASVAPRYFSNYVPMNNAYLAAGTGGAIPAVDYVMTSAYDFFDAGDGYGIDAWFNPDHLHPLPNGNRANAVLAREAIYAIAGLPPDPVPDGGEGHGQHFIVDQWHASSLAANANLLLGRATGAQVAAQIRRACRLTDFSVQTNDLGTAAVPAAGSAMTVQVIRMDWRGFEYPNQTIGRLEIGEFNIERPVDVGAEVEFTAGDLVYVNVITGSGWTSTTVQPGIGLGFTEI